MAATRNVYCDKSHVISIWLNDVSSNKSILKLTNSAFRGNVRLLSSWE